MHTTFSPTPGVTRCFINCPKCNKQVRISVFEIEPSVHGDGKFVKRWHLKALVKCECGFEGFRSVGSFQAKGR